MAANTGERREKPRGVMLIGFEPREAARLTAALAQVGRPAYPAASQRDVVDLLSTAPVGIALADLEGAFSEVLQAIEAVRVSRPHRPLLGVGSVDAGAAMTDALRVLGFEGFIRAGVSPQELVFRVNGAQYPERRGGASRRVPTDLPASFDGPGGSGEGRVLNLSRTGLFLAAEQLLPVDRRVTVRLELEPRAAPVTTTCRVVWTNTGEHQRYFHGMGLEFVDPEPAAKAALDAFLSRAIAEMDGERTA
jgi:uncharacterized protein (TIGR02266 family)